MKAVGLTRSLCPECGKTIPAELVEADGKVLMKKSCPEHGDFEDVHWGSTKTYKRYMKWLYTGSGICNAKPSTSNCPFDCGLCENHKSDTVLGIIDVTNRCNFNCPICFANANKSGYVYDPSKQQIEKMLDMLVAQKPVRCWAVMFSGGEPTVRDDLPDMIRMAHEKQFYTLIATNGKRLAEDKAFCKQVVDAGLDTVYLQFDGVTPEPYETVRGFNALPLKLNAIENLRGLGFDNVVLVPTLIKGTNDSQVGGIIRFALDNLDVVSGVNFQPVSFTGRISKQKLKEQRITIPDLIDLLSVQTDGLLSQDDFYPVPISIPLSQFLSKKKGGGERSCHPVCGAVTYLIKTKRGVLPLPHLVDIEKIMLLLKEANDGRWNKAKLMLQLPSVMKVRDFAVNRWLLSWIKDVLTLHKDTARSHAANTLFVGAMHFQDKYNIDLERTERCIIHYAAPDGRIYPFCTYNSIHRQEIEKRFSVPLGERN